MKIFYGLVHKDENSAFGITFPDAPGCFSAADKEVDLLTNAQDALSLYVEGETVPLTRTIAELLQDDQVAREIAAGAFILAVPLIESRRKARYNLMLDEELVASVDRIAKVSGVSRSEFVAQAVQSQLGSEVRAVFAGKNERRLARSATTGESVAISVAAKVLKSKSATKAEKAVAASALTQKGSTEKTSAKVASSAAKILKSKSASKDAKSAAASALTQKKK
jgi:predicted RNase H-like HicB family nuclease/metal-responsive CopG/Arc/MetJ family transcriptional regulator